MIINTLGKLWEKSRNRQQHRITVRILLLICVLFANVITSKLYGYAAGNKDKQINILNIADGYVLPEKKSVTLKLKLPSKVKRGNLVFTSSKTKVATVDGKGKIVAKKKGWTYITISDKKNKKQKTRVKLYVGRRISKITLVKPKSGVTLTVGKSYQVTWKVVPSGATFKKLSWESSDKSICKVSSSGKLAAKKAGTAIITAKAKDGSGKNMKFRVKVNAKKKGSASGSDNKKQDSTTESPWTGNVEPKVTSLVIKTDLNYPYLKRDDKTTFKAEVEPYGASDSVTWSSSDPSVVTVSDDGVVTALEYGSAVITAAATGSDVKDTYTIRVPSLADSHVTLIAHRGLSAAAPENTMAAFGLAAQADNCFGAIECDVHRTKDGQYIISHDPNLKRIFGEDLLIRECNYEDIRDLTAVGGNGVDQYPEAKLCTLEDYMEILKNSNKQAVIELKESYGQENSDELYELISSYGINDRVDIISFNRTALLEMSRSIESLSDRVEVKPDLFLLCNDSDSLVDGISLKQWAVDQRYGLDAWYYTTTEETVSFMHGADEKIGVWTVDQFDVACHFIFDLGVDYVTSNRPLF